MSSTRELLIVSPYIKAKAMQRVFELASSACQITVYTQWSPYDIAVGASDLDVYDLITGRNSGEMFLCPKLHAKYYRADDRFWFGSANLTLSGLDLGDSYPNLEILSVPSSVGKPNFEFEKHLSQCSLRVTQEMKDEMSDSAAEIQQVKQPPASVQKSKELIVPPFFGQMFCTSDPRLFFSWINGKDSHLNDQELRAARLDFALLEQHCPHLTSDLARPVAKSVFLQMPIFHDVVSKFNPSDGRWVGFGEVKEFLLRKHKDLLDNSAATVILQATMAWAVYLFPSRYEIYQYNVSQQLRRKS